MSASSWLVQRGSCTRAGLSVHAELTAGPKLAPDRPHLITSHHTQELGGRTGVTHIYASTGQETVDAVGRGSIVSLYLTNQTVGTEPNVG